MTLRIYLLIILLSLCGITRIEAQSNTSTENDTIGKTSLFFELGGSGWLYSVNIDHKIHPFISLRGGLTAVPDGDFRFIGAPMIINTLPGWNSHHFEIGAGVLVGRFSNHSMDLIEPYFKNTIQPGESNNIAFMALNTGYRYQPLNKNLFFKVAYTPFITNKGWHHWAGIGAGFTLKN